MIGPEYSVESVSRAGKHHTYAITQKFTSAPPYFVETGHLVPAALTPEVRESIEAEVHAALTKFEMVTGSSHAEVILTADGPTIVEIAGRLGGDLIPRLVWESLGVNLYDEELNAILGRAEISETSRDAVVSAVRFYEVEPGTRIVWPSTSSVQDTLLARTMRDSKHWYPHYVDAPVVDGAGRRLGYCLMVGNREEVEASFELATRLAPQKAVGGIS